MLCLPVFVSLERRHRAERDGTDTDVAHTASDFVNRHRWGTHCSVAHTTDVAHTTRLYLSLRP